MYMKFLPDFCYFATALVNKGKLLTDLAWPPRLCCFSVSGNLLLNWIEFEGIHFGAFTKSSSHLLSNMVHVLLHSHTRNPHRGRKLGIFLLILHLQWLLKVLVKLRPLQASSCSWSSLIFLVGATHRDGASWGQIKSTKLPE